MNVARVLSSGRQNYTHGIIDTYFSFIFALAVSKENSKMVIFAMKTTMLAMGAPYSIKTDNGSTYPPTQFKVFCADWNIACKAGIPKDKPLSSMQTLHLKNNYKMGKWDSYTPTRKINISLIYIKILNFDKSGLTPTYKHWGAMLS